MSSNKNTSLEISELQKFFFHFHLPASVNFNFNPRQSSDIGHFLYNIAKNFGNAPVQDITNKKVDRFSNKMCRLTRLRLDTIFQEAGFIDYILKLEK